MIRSAACAPPPNRSRIACLDGLRGVLALLVLIGHIVHIDFESRMLDPIAIECVFVFFALSAHVLTRSWGTVSFPVFLLRRLVRLWPVFAVCVGLSAALSGTPLELSWFTFLAIVDPVDPPSWSLAVEARAMLLMPIIVWTGRGSLWRTFAAAAIWFGLVGPTQSATMGISFLAGARWSSLTPRMPAFEGPACQWLGRISYSLYLSHWAVISALHGIWGRPGAILEIPVCLAVGHGVWLVVERPSIAWSRRIQGRLAAQGGHGDRRAQSRKADGKADKLSAAANCARPCADHCAGRTVGLPNGP